ncbi:MAG: M1 family metallopeptidase [Rhodothermales bacterium]
MNGRFYLLAPLLLLLVFSTEQAAARQSGSDTPLHNRAYFAPLDLPAASGSRTGSGEPGEAYWQQRAGYHIQVTLDPATHRLTGTATITYTNKAPYALDYLWLQLDQNLFAEGSRGALLQPGNSRWRGSFEGGGFDITNVELVRGHRRTMAPVLIDDTRLRIALDTPLPPGGSSIDIDIDFAFTVPEYGADRMGRLDVEQGTVYEFAQWYPRMYVYDDVNGWNAMPYLGQGEFYLEYGTFDVEITVPRDFVVVATGELQNEADVLTRDQRQRLGQARRSDETVAIIREDEVGRPESRPATTEMLTWIFHAENVRDFAWAASQAFILDAAAWDGILLMSAYPREGLGTDDQQGWEHSTQFMRHSIRYYSETWFRYPYPVAVNVAGIVGGMEYPGIVFCSVRARNQGLFGVTDHEFGHTWFPMIVGSDERRYAWMDEGFNTFINHYSNIAYYGDEATRTGRLAADFIARRMQEPIADQPSYTFPDQIRREGLGFLAYRKPGAGLVLLRDYILGPERFDTAFREYVARWAFKHPQPSDFFRTIEDVAGEDLDWFWRGWFFSTDKLDQALADVAIGEQTTIEVTHREGLMMPVEVKLEFADGTSRRLRIPVEAFFTTDTYRLTLDRTDLIGVTLDPDILLPDVQRGNNAWRREGVPVPPKPKG